MDTLKKYYTEEQKAELEYFCSGDAELFSKRKRKIRLAAQNELNLMEREETKKAQYDFSLNYVGNQSLLNQIERIEKNFLPIRKKVSKEEYKKQFKEILELRNQFAVSAGFANYLEYAYKLLGVDEDILEKILKRGSEQEWSDGDLLREKIQKWKNEKSLSKENQIDLLKSVLDRFNLNIEWNEVRIHNNDLPQFYIGNCIAIDIPSESHVLINQVSGLSGFSILMHEIGHAFYYNNIPEDRAEWKNRPYNAIVEEFIALTFEDLVYSSNFLRTFLNTEDDLLFEKLNYQTNYLYCCAMFEKNIYTKVEADFDLEWETACDRFSVPRDREWRAPHFFLSYPGFFAVDVIAGYLVKLFYKYIGKDYGIISEYLKKNICEPGYNLDFYRMASQLGMEL